MPCLSSPSHKKHGIIVRILCFVGGSWISDFGHSEDSVLPCHSPSSFLPMPFLHKSASKRHYRTSQQSSFSVSVSVSLQRRDIFFYIIKKLYKYFEPLLLILSFCNRKHHNTSSQCFINRKQTQHFLLNLIEWFSGKSTGAIFI